MNTNAPERNFSVRVDVLNPGQFFACCGLLELAHRLWPGAEGWFESERFHIAAPNADDDAFAVLLRQLCDADLCSDGDDDDPKISPLRLGKPFELRLDWWQDDDGVGGMLKTWAGQQSVLRIADAMKNAIAPEPDERILDHSRVVTAPANRSKVVEPFYFDARRFAHPLDIGFSLDVQDAETAAYPAVELLCLIGLQRFRPRPERNDKRTFIYSVWLTPLPPCVASAAACDGIPADQQFQRFRFRLLFRDDQKRYKAFGFATPMGGES